MLKVYINGLVPGDGSNRPGDPGTRVAVIDESKKIGTVERELINQMADSRGVVEGLIPDKYVGGTLKVVIREVGFIPFSANQEVKPYGLFLTARLEKDTVVDQNVVAKRLNLSTWDAWKTDANFVDAQGNLQDMVRGIENTNVVVTATIVLLTLGSVVGLAFVLWWVAIIGGVAVWVATEFLSPIATGVKTRMPIPYRIFLAIRKKF